MLGLAAYDRPLVDQAVLPVDDVHRLVERLLGMPVTDRLDLGPGGELTARVWGHGIVGMMHGAGDWWLRERPCSREQLVTQLADLLWGQLAAVEDRAGGPGF